MSRFYLQYLQNIFVLCRFLLRNKLICNLLDYIQHLFLQNLAVRSVFSIMKQYTFSLINYRFLFIPKIPLIKSCHKKLRKKKQFRNFEPDLIFVLIFV